MNWYNTAALEGYGEGGHAIIPVKAERDKFIQELRALNLSPYAFAGRSPYKLRKAQQKFRERRASVSEAIWKYLTDHGLLKDALYSTKGWRQQTAKARAALKNRKAPKRKSGRKQKKVYPPIEIADDEDEDEEISREDLEELNAALAREGRMLENTMKKNS